MKTSDFDYELPEELIAQEPPVERGTSRMMVLHRQSGKIEHKTISDIPGYLNAGDMLVVNNTRVFPARIFGTRIATGGKVELLLVEEVAGGKWQVARESVWSCFLKARSRPDVGEKMELANGRIYGEVMDVMGQRISLKLSCDDPLFDVLEEEGFAPVPPYIKRDYDSATRLSSIASAAESHSPLATRIATDRERYQTVYAERVGAVAAPTAGLHFTDDLLEVIAKGGVMREDITLHVGPGTFKPVEVDEVEEHAMEAEWYEVSKKTAENINRTKTAGGRIVAVGSTSVRTLETVVSDDGFVNAGQGKSEIFIYPPYEFKAVDVMLTNFHLPKSSLIMMVSALAGRELVLKAYKEAIEQKYRFYSYGDCMLVM